MAALSDRTGQGPADTCRDGIGLPGTDGFGESPFAGKSLAVAAAAVGRLKVSGGKRGLQSAKRDLPVPGKCGRLKTLSKTGDRGCHSAGEESPGFTGQDAG